RDDIDQYPCTADDIIEREATVAEQDTVSVWLPEIVRGEGIHGHAVLSGAADDCLRAQVPPQFQADMQPRFQPLQPGEGCDRREDVTEGGALRRVVPPHPLDM